MQLTAAPCTIRTAVIVARRPGRKGLAVRAQAEPVKRRAALSGLVILPALLATAPALAFGKDPRVAMKEKEARRAKLRETAEKMKTSQKSEAAFEDSKYSLPEDSTTPNLRALDK